MTTPIYIFNKYYVLYHNIISIAISQNRYKSTEQYYESHHIEPRSFGGLNDLDNLVLLTAMEHYICHYLLTKFTTTKCKIRMIFAFNMMNVSNKTHNRYMSKLYEYNKNQMPRGKDHPNYGKKHSNETKIKMANSSNHNTPMLGKKHSNETKKQLSIIRKRQYTGINHSHGFSGYYITPWGKFESSRSASTNLLNYQTIQKWCKNPNKIINNRMYAKSNYLKSLSINSVGKSIYEIGFGFINYTTFS